MINNSFLQRHVSCHNPMIFQIWSFKKIRVHFMCCNAISFAHSVVKKQFKLILTNSACIMVLDECLMPFACSSWSRRGSRYRASSSSWFDDIMKRLCFAPIDAARLGWFVSEWFEHRKIHCITFVRPYMYNSSRVIKEIILKIALKIKWFLLNLCFWNYNIRLDENFTLRETRVTTFVITFAWYVTSQRVVVA